MVAAMELISGMDDFRLKPPMLRSVVRDRLPDEKRPLPTPTELAAVLSHVRTHGLLSERLPDTADRKLVDAWSAAVDGWVERVLLLASSRVPDKCWAGVCFLGVTCEECCSDRFHSSYPVWFQKLLENLQAPSGTHFKKVACCASLTDFFTRLAGFSNFKKDGTSFAGKIVGPVLQLLNEDAGEIVWEGAANLLCTLIHFFPSSIQRHYDNVEAVLSSKIMAAKCSLNTCKKFGRCLALLPKVKGDENSWSLIMQKILIALNSILTDAFQGHEEEKKGLEIMKMIIPPGKDTPPPLGGQTLLGEASEPATKRLCELLVPRVTTLMHSCCIMLTNPYSFQVLVPVHSLLATVGRVLQMNGSLRGSVFPFTTSMHQELLCAELPALHLDSLDLLIAIIKGLRSQLLPHGSNVVRLLTEYFGRAKLSSIRIKVYTILEMLLISMGFGMALYLSQEVIKNAFADLSDCIGSGTRFSVTPSSIVDGEALRQNYQRKRKRALVSPVEYPNEVDLSLKTISKKPQYPLSVKIAALKALNALLTVGGSLRSECSRPDVDCLLIKVATNACDAGWAEELADESSSDLDFQLAALEALLSSLLSPTQTRPRYLSQGLDLFRRGKQETGTKIAAFCAHALLALEVLIHPRALPLWDPPPKSSLDEGSDKRFGGSTCNSGFEQNLPSFSRSDLDLLDDEDEELCNYWFDNNDEQTLVEGRILNDKHTEPSSRVSEDITEKPLAINSEVSHDVSERENTSQNINVEMACLVREETTVERDEAEKSKSRNETIYIASDDKVNFSAGRSDVPAMEIALAKDDSPLGISTNLSNHGGGAPDTSANMIKEDAAQRRSSAFYKEKDAMLSYDSDAASEDSLPDIVDGDPDTD